MGKDFFNIHLNVLGSLLICSSAMLTGGREFNVVLPLLIYCIKKPGIVLAAEKESRDEK